MPSFNPSPRQLAVRDFILDPTLGSLTIDAKAGAAKTTTIVWVASQLPVRAPGALMANQIRFVAFNKNIVEDLKPRLPAHVVCTTCHSLGFTALRGIIGRDVRVESGKVRKLVWNACDRDNPDTQAIIRLVGMAKNAGLGCLLDDTPTNWQSLVDHYSLDLESPATSIRIAQAVLCASNRDLAQIDFDDMLYLPVLLGARFSPQDWIFVDEAQDTNNIQIEIIDRSRAPGCRVVAVGDPNQAIYGFRGANSNSMDLISSRFASQTLPLDVCYRCAKRIVTEVQSIVPDIKAADGALEGEVLSLPTYLPSDFVPGSAILCRNKAPLVGMAYGLLQRDVPCVILGKDIGKALIDLVKKLRAASLEDLQGKLTVWEQREAAQAIKEDKSPENIYDQATCIRFFINGLDEDARTVLDLVAKIELMFSDDTAGRFGRVTLSTIHKAKGLEYDTVFLLDKHLLPSPYARQPWQAQQERNLTYVAKTRAKLRLVYINSDAWKLEENKPNA